MKSSRGYCNAIEFILKVTKAKRGLHEYLKTGSNYLIFCYEIIFKFKGIFKAV